jgi:hypothetical protein
MMIDATVAPKVGFVSPFGTTVCNVNHINARPQALERAAARHERRLFPVACRPLLGRAWHRMTLWAPCPSASSHARLPASTPSSTPPALPAPGGPQGAHDATTSATAPHALAGRGQHAIRRAGHGRGTPAPHPSGGDSGGRRWRRAGAMGAQPPPRVCARPPAGPPHRRLGVRLGLVAAGPSRAERAPQRAWPTPATARAVYGGPCGGAGGRVLQRGGPAPGPTRSS